MATKKPKGLGMGLEALLGPKVKEAINLDGTAATPDLPSTLLLDDMVAYRRVLGAPGREVALYHRPSYGRIRDVRLLREAIRAVLAEGSGVAVAGKPLSPG